MAKIAVHQRLPLGLRHARLEPLECQFEHRMGIIVEIVDVAIAAQLRRTIHDRQHTFERRDIDGVDARENFAALACQSGPYVGEFRIAQDFACDGLAGQPVHHIADAGVVFRLEHISHARRRHAGRARRLDDDRLGFQGHGIRSLARRTRRAAGTAPQDERVDVIGHLRIERPCFLTGATRQPRQRADAFETGNGVREGTFESGLEIGGHKNARGGAETRRSKSATRLNLASGPQFSCAHSHAIPISRSFPGLIVWTLLPRPPRLCVATFFFTPSASNARLRRARKGRAGPATPRREAI